MKISCRSLPHGLDISLAKGSTHLFICLGPAVGHDIYPCHAIHIAHPSVWAAFSFASEGASQPKRTRQRICVCSQLRMQDTQDTQSEHPDTHPRAAWAAAPWIPVSRYHLPATKYETRFTCQQPASEKLLFAMANRPPCWCSAYKANK